jgi:hypothetical protein
VSWMPKGISCVMVVYSRGPLGLSHTPAGTCHTTACMMGANYITDLVRVPGSTHPLMQARSTSTTQTPVCFAS